MSLITPWPVTTLSRAIIGLSCKYLIRGLGKWGGWEGLASPGLLATLLLLRAQGRHWRPLCQRLEREEEEEEGHSQAASGALMLWPPRRGRASRHLHAGNSQATKFNGNQLPSPSSTLHAQRICAHFNSNDSQMCLSLPTFLFSPNRPARYGSPPFCQNIYCPSDGGPGEIGKLPS